jgi:hypothetical protein
MTTLIMEGFRPMPVYVAMPNADRPGWWIVAEGDNVGAPIIAHCGNETFARAIAQAMNQERSHALKSIGLIQVTVRRPGEERLN